MNIEETIRQIVCEEIDKREQATNLIPIADFCKNHNLSRVTVWRAEKSGKLKTVRIGKKVFVNPHQFIR
jgi:hypothetical protein